MKHVHTYEEFLNEGQDDWRDDFYSEKKTLRKKYFAKSSNEIAIEAAKKVAKTYNIKYQDILKTETPDNNMTGVKTWDKEGNIK